MFPVLLWNQFLTLRSLASQVNTITEKKWWSKIVVLASISVLLLKSCPVVCITLNYPKWFQAFLTYTSSSAAVIQTRLICHTCGNTGRILCCSYAVTGGIGWKISVSNWWEEFHNSYDVIWLCYWEEISVYDGTLVWNSGLELDSSCAIKTSFIYSVIMNMSANNSTCRVSERLRRA